MVPSSPPSAVPSSLLFFRVSWISNNEPIAENAAIPLLGQDDSIDDILLIWMGGDAMKYYGRTQTSWREMGGGVGGGRHQQQQHQNNTSSTTTKQYDKSHKIKQLTFTSI